MNKHTVAEKEIPWVGARDILSLCAILSVAVGLFFLYLAWSGQLSGSIGPADQYQSAVARNIAAGRGLTTDIVYPLCLKKLGGDLAQFPDVVYAPLHSILLSVFFSLFGSSDQTILLFCFCLYLSSIAILYFAAKKLFDWRTACAGSAIYAANIVVLRMTVESPGIWLPMIIFSLLAFSLYHPPSTPKRLVLSGALMGALYLCRYAVMLSILPCVLGYLCFSLNRDRLKCIAYFLGGFGAIALPFVIRNTVVGVNPLFGMSFYQYFQDYAGGGGLAYYSSLVPKDVHSGPLIPTIEEFIKYLSYALVRASGNILPVFIIFGLLIPPASAVRKWVIALIATLSLQLSLAKIVGTRVIIPSYLPVFTVLYIPVFSVAGTYVFFQMLDKFSGSLSSRGRKAIVICFIALNLLPIMVMSFPKSPDATSYWICPYLWPKDTYKHIMSLEKGDRRIIFTDVPELVAWYSGSISIILPNDLQSLFDIQKLYPDIEGILFSSTVFVPNMGDYDPIYQDAYKLAADGYRVPGLPYSRCRISKVDGEMYIFSQSSTALSPSQTAGDGKTAPGP